MVEPSSRATADEASGRRRWRAIAPYVVAIFAAAFLIFLVQPMVGKRILPWFGGVPAVWTLCLAFFQTALFASYAYAHALNRFAPIRLQPLIHLVVAVAAFISLPVLPTEDAIPSGASNPTLDVLRILVRYVALPFLLLGSTGPLVQAWFARAHPTRSPYPLYAVSNAGSLLALVAYPFVLEPRLPLSETGTLWSAGFVVAALSVLACGAPMLRLPSAPSVNAVEPQANAGDRVGPADVALWMLLSGSAVVLLMGVTNALCLDVASVPFLWILPLATYLVTFIVCFSSERAYSRAPWLIVALAGGTLVHAESILPAVLFSWIEPLMERIQIQIALYTALLLGACMVLHGELYRTRPAPRSLTAFYLSLSAGGAVGGLFVGVVAPRVFPGYWELAVGMAIASVLVLLALRRDPSSFLSSRAPTWRLATASTLLLVAVLYGGWRTVNPAARPLHQERSFFGVLRVFETGKQGATQTQLFNGTTMHGLQFGAEAARRQPTSYFGRATGVGLVMAARAEDQPTRVGIIGLGIGTLAAYGREGDLFRFYEIDPAVVRIARDEEYFSYLTDSPAEIEVVLGDARLQIAEEQANRARQDFDILIVDAFSSDSIPVHLLTREAFAHYAAALADDGLLAIHVSNRHFDLTSLVSRMGYGAGLSNLIVLTGSAPRMLSIQARWVVLARNPERLRRLESVVLHQHRSLGLPPSLIRTARLAEVETRYLSLWTDDYSDLFGVLRPWL